MNIQDRIQAISCLSQRIRKELDSNLDEIVSRASAENPWFTIESIRQAFDGLLYMIQNEKVASWVAGYRLDPREPKRVGIVMAGNLPMVGFHDLLSVIMAGNIAVVKTSSQDSHLITKMIEWLKDCDDRLKSRIEVRDRLEAIDAVIATGSDNSARYFHYYFSRYPNVIRKNRTSIAVLTGKETNEDLQALGHDIFDYFGQGCRNVSKIFLPAGFKPERLLDQWQGFSTALDHHKYRNNYDYYKSILLVNGVSHLDTGFSLLQESEDLVAPISLNYYGFYETIEEVTGVVKEHEDKIQCIVSTDQRFEGVGFGKTQSPELWDYADDVDTLQFLDQL